MQGRVPELAAALGGQGSTKSATGGTVASKTTMPPSAVAPAPAATAQQKKEQSARFDSRGEDFVPARRLEQ